ncbi:MAG: hypothetical protein QW407_01255 [Thermofilaceae archaeon]
MWRVLGSRKRDEKDDFEWLRESHGLVSIVVLGTSGLKALSQYMQRLLARLERDAIAVVAGDKYAALRAGFPEDSIIEIYGGPAGLNRRFGWTCMQPYLDKILERVEPAHLVIICSFLGGGVGSNALLLADEILRRSETKRALVLSGPPLTRWPVILENFKAAISDYRELREKFGDRIALILLSPGAELESLRDVDLESKLRMLMGETLATSVALSKFGKDPLNLHNLIAKNKSGISIATGISISHEGDPRRAFETVAHTIGWMTKDATLLSLGVLKPVINEDSSAIAMLIGPNYVSSTEAESVMKTNLSTLLVRLKPDLGGSRDLDNVAVDYWFFTDNRLQTVTAFVLITSVGIEGI